MLNCFQFVDNNCNNEHLAFNRALTKKQNFLLLFSQNICFISFETSKFQTKLNRTRNDHLIDFEKFELKRIAADRHKTSAND